MPSNLNELQDIVGLLNEKLKTLRESGNLPAFYYLEDTIEKLKNYIREKELMQKTELKQ